MDSGVTWADWDSYQQLVYKKVESQLYYWESSIFPIYNKSNQRPRAQTYWNRIVPYYQIYILDVHAYFNIFPLKFFNQTQKIIEIFVHIQKIIGEK